MSDNAFRTETVETAAGTYTVGLHYHDSPENPLDNMSRFSTAYLAGGRDFCQMAINGEATERSLNEKYLVDTPADLLKRAIERGHSLAAVVRYFRVFHGARGFVELNRIIGNGGSYIEANQVRLPEDQTAFCTETDTRAAERQFDGLAFVVPLDLGAKGAGFRILDEGTETEENALELVKGEMETYAAYTRGEVYGYTVTRDEDETVIDSCWGYYGDGEFEYMLEQGRDSAEHDAVVCAKAAAVAAWLAAEAEWNHRRDIATTRVELRNLIDVLEYAADGEERDYEESDEEGRENHVWPKIQRALNYVERQLEAVVDYGNAWENDIDDAAILAEGYEARASIADVKVGDVLRVRGDGYTSDAPLTDRRVTRIDTSGGAGWVCVCLDGTSATISGGPERQVVRVIRGNA